MYNIHYLFLYNILHDFIYFFIYTLHFIFLYYYIFDTYLFSMQNLHRSLKLAKILMVVLKNSHQKIYYDCFKCNIYYILYIYYYYFVIFFILYIINGPQRNNKIKILV